MGILIALSNSFGFFLVILALGYSLVGFPRKIKNSIIKDKKISINLIKLEIIGKKLDEYLILLENVYKLVFQLSKKIEEDEKSQFKEQIAFGVSLMNKNIIKHFSSPLEDRYDEGIVNSTFKLLTKKSFKKTISELRTLNIKYLRLKYKETSINDDIRYYQLSKNTKRFRIRNIFYLVFFIISIIFSLVCFIIEILIPFQTRFKFNIYNITSNYINEEVTFIFFVFLMIYIIICVIFAILTIEIKSFYFLQKNNTCFKSLIFYTCNISTVATPLCFNFVQMFGFKNTHFIKVMGNFDIVPIFGTQFPDIFPIVLIIFVLLNLFNFYKFIKKYFRNEELYVVEPSQMISISIEQSSLNNTNS